MCTKECCHGNKRSKEELSRSEAADQLSQLARELRDGRISLGRETKLLPASDELELTAEFEGDRLKIDMKWHV